MQIHREREVQFHVLHAKFILKFTPLATGGCVLCCVQIDHVSLGVSSGRVAVRQAITRFSDNPDVSVMSRWVDVDVVTWGWGVPHCRVGQGIAHIAG